jgi:hypothetical protein
MRKKDKWRETARTRFVRLLLWVILNDIIIIGNKKVDNIKYYHLNWRDNVDRMQVGNIRQMSQDSTKISENMKLRISFKPCNPGDRRRSEEDLQV